MACRWSGKSMLRRAARGRCRLRGLPLIAPRSLGRCSLLTRGIARLLCEIGVQRIVAGVSLPVNSGAQLGYGFKIDRPQIVDRAQARPDALARAGPIPESPGAAAGCAGAGLPSPIRTCSGNGASRGSGLPPIAGCSRRRDGVPDAPAVLHHQIVLHGNEEARAAGVALAA